MCPCRCHVDAQLRFSARTRRGRIECWSTLNTKFDVQVSRQPPKENFEKFIILEINIHNGRCARRGGRAVPFTFDQMRSSCHHCRAWAMSRPDWTSPSAWTGQCGAEVATSSRTESGPLSSASSASFADSETKSKVHTQRRQQTNESIVLEANSHCLDSVNTFAKRMQFA